MKHSRQQNQQYAASPQNLRKELKPRPLETFRFQGGKVCVRACFQSGHSFDGYCCRIDFSPIGTNKIGVETERYSLFYAYFQFWKKNFPKKVNYKHSLRAAFPQFSLRYCLSVRISSHLTERCSSWNTAHFF